MVTLVFWRHAGGMQDSMACRSEDEAVSFVDRLVEAGVVAVWTQPLPWDRGGRESWQSLRAREVAGVVR